MATWGRVAVWITLLAGLGAAAAPLSPGWGSSRGRGRSTVLLAVSAIACAAATGVLVRALVVGDYSLTYVADFSRRGATWPYRAAALWGGMAGSLLWLATLVGLVGVGVALRLERDGLDRDGPDRGPREGVAAVTGGVVAVLVALVLAFADPFATLDVPAIHGAGLTPILEHAAMLYHPPLLYLGLATLVGPFALTVVALVDRRLDDAWLATVRRLSLLPWTLLAVGMVAGAHWAYVELGWGGYWAWDPVENTALLPWLAMTVLLHGTRGARTDRPPVGRVALAGLACLPFVLALLGSLLTRSGATSSVHAFAESRAIGRALAVVVAAVVVGVAVLLRRAAGQAPSSASTTHGSAAWIADPPAGEARLLVTVARLVGAHLALVGAALAVVLAGTLWPLWADLRGGDGVAVQGRYFAQFTGPLLAMALALVCLVPVAVSCRGSLRSVGAAALAAGGGGLALLLAAAPSVDPPRVLLAFAAGACVGSALVGALGARRHRSDGAPALGGHLAHAALGLLALGIAGTATGGNHVVSLRSGESATVLGHEVAYDGVRVEDGPVAGSDAVVADVTTGGQKLAPSLVGYPDRGVLLAESALRSTPLVDVQVTLRDARDDGTALLEVGVHPLQVLVWWGGLAVVAAGAFATWEAGARDRRRGETRHLDAPVDRVVSRAERTDP